MRARSTAEVKESWAWARGRRTRLVPLLVASYSAELLGLGGVLFFGIGLVATMPLWATLIERFSGGATRARGREQVGLAMGLAGVVILNPRRFPQGVATGGVLVCSLETFLSQQPPNPSFIHCLQ